jgi:hypothetical protein
MESLTHDTPGTPATSDARVPGPRVTLHVLRVVAVIHALSMIAQPALAGLYLSGKVDALATHQINAVIIALFDLVQVFAAVAFAWKGRGRFWPLWASLAVLVAGEAQVGVGLEGIVAVHIPLGVSIIAMQILLTVWLFRSDTAVARVRRPRGERVR